MAGGSARAVVLVAAAVWVAAAVAAMSTGGAESEVASVVGLTTRAPSTTVSERSSGVEQVNAVPTTGPPPTPPAPSTSSQPTQRDPSWVATVILACGGEDSSRVVAAFDAQTGEYEIAGLYRAESATGAGRLFQLAVGDEIAADAPLRWHINGVFLGPWPVDEVIDDCV
ncbi:MAG: hypothetical protein AAGA99_00410 [Actinomycetota bacterium]